MNTPRKVRIGVLGVANIARRSVIPAIKSLPEYFELVAIASRSEEKGSNAAKEFGCVPVSGYDALIRNDQIDAIYIPLPTGLHEKWINEALRAGKHVYAEKSIASTAAMAVDMVATARTAKRALMEGFMFQYHSQHQRVIGLLKQGAIGEVRHFSSSFGFPPLKSTDFRYDEKIGGGALLDAAAYPLRATHFLLGDSLEVRAATLYVDSSYGTNIFGSAFLADRNGLGASIVFGFDNFYQCRYEILGSTGKITATRAFTPGPTFRPQIIIENSNDKTVIDAEPDNHFVRALQEFYRIIWDSPAREKHYSEILLQSRSLSLIKTLSGPAKSLKID